MPSTANFFAALSVAASFMPAVHACGETLLSANFNTHTGAMRPWTREMAEADFPVGLKHTLGIGRASAGEGALSILHPAGLCPCPFSRHFQLISTGLWTYVVLVGFGCVQLVLFLIVSCGCVCSRVGAILVLRLQSATPSGRHVLL
jgi:hypothetical protein